MRPATGGAIGDSQNYFSFLGPKIWGKRPELFPGKTLHPALLRCLRLNLRTRQIDCYDYTQSANPPILHRKESFLPPSDPLLAKFARLMAQEEKHGLLEDAGGIGTRERWARRLSERGFALRGHRLVKRKEPSLPGSDGEDSP